MILKIRGRVCYLLALVPLVYLIWLVSKYAVDVPSSDQWDFVPTLEKTYQGTLTFRDLWQQFNEHRIIFPKLIMLGLARLTEWNIAWEVAMNVILAAGTFAVFAWRIRRTARELVMPELRWVIPACALILFSICQFENWLWGWQIQMWLNVLATAAGLVLLADKEFSWTRFGGAAVLGVIGTYSFANGLLFWPIGLLLLLQTTRGRTEKRYGIAGWSILSVLVYWSYLWQYQKPARHPSPSLFIHHPAECVSYVLKFIGGNCCQYYSLGPTTTRGAVALAWGLIGLIAAAWSAWMLGRMKLANRIQMLPYVGMSLYSVGTALMTAVGRLGLGSDHALQSRYCTMAAPLWISLVLWLAILARGNAEKAPLPEKTHHKESFIDARMNFPSSLRTSLVVLGVGSFEAEEAIRDMSGALTYGKTCLIEHVNHPDAPFNPQRLTLLHPRPNVVLEQYPTLMKRRLSLFADRKH